MESQTTKNLQLIGVLAIILFLSSCNFSDKKVTRGDGNVIKTTVVLDYFDEIDLQGAFNVKLSQGTELQAIIETDENLQELVDVEVKGGTLFINTNREVMLRPTKMELFITYPELKRFTIGGACKLVSEEAITSQTLVFDLSGAAEIDLSIMAEVLRTNLSGAGSIRFEGQALQHYVELSGASNLQAEKLVTEVTEINLSGAGSANVFASELLKASLSGVGSIRYFGNPSQTQINKSGLGSIKSAD